MSAAKSDTSEWIALDAESRNWRAWVLGVGSPPPKVVHSLEAAAACAPGADILVAGLPGTPGAAVPQKPAHLKPIRGHQAGLFAAPTLTQNSPKGLLQTAALKIDAFLSLNPDWDGVICLPGRHTHWVQVSADEVVSFQSFATTQIIDSFCGADTPDADVLRTHMQDVMSRPERMAAKLAEAQIGQQSGALTAETTAGWIWGACLGAELAASRPYWLGQNLALIAPDSLQDPYNTALESQGLMATLADEDHLTRLGFERAWARKGG